MTNATMDEPRTVRDMVIAGMLALARKRLLGLEQSRAPRIVIEAQKAVVATLQSGDPGFRGLAEYGDRTVESVQHGTGRGGKHWVRYETAEGPVWFYPASRFGPCLSGREM